MPFKKSRKTYKKRPFKRTYRKKRGIPNSVRSQTAPLPDRYFTKLRYSELAGATYSQAAGSPATYQFRINSIYDPNYTGTGHQPLGHDELGALYNRYRVYGMRYKITFINRSTSYQAECALQLRPNVSAHTSMDTVFEAPYSKKCIVGIEGGSSIKVLKGYASVAKIRGVSKKTVSADDTYQAQVGANPSVEPILTIYVRNNDATVDLFMAFRVELEYFVCFFDRKILNQS
uniref:hypothetical protein n=1 Tax=Aliarcobacter sp. TaxID=2321116 RepID=UPI004047FF53